MIEENNSNNNNKNKLLIGSIIGVITLVIVVVGATYAFFSLNVTSDNTNTNVNVQMGKQNSVVLKGIENEGLHIKVSTEDMSETNIGKSYYATTEEGKNYLTEADEQRNLHIAELRVDANGGKIEPTNICTAKLKVVKTGNMREELKQGDAILHIEGGRSKHDIDLGLLLPEYPIEFEITETKTFPINGYLKLNNTDEEQNYLAEKQLNVDITIGEVSCKDKNEKDAVEVILANSDKKETGERGSLENAEDVSARGDVLRRFQGTAEEVQDNYICFGTKDKTDCTTDRDHYMYRIIGVAINNDEETNTQYGQLKIQKKEVLTNKMQWHSNSSVNVYFDEADIHTNINDQYWNVEDYVSTEWKKNVAKHTWLLGDALLEGGNGADQIGEKVFQIENGQVATTYYRFLGFATEFKDKPEGVLEYTLSDGIGQKIYYKKITDETWTDNLENAEVGVINASDYDLSIDANTNCRAETEISKCKSGWMHISNNDDVFGDEWMMTDGGYAVSTNNYKALLIAASGRISAWPFDVLEYVRPIIYLNSGLQLSGEGTLENPYIITN